MKPALKKSDSTVYECIKRLFLFEQREFKYANEF